MLDEKEIQKMIRCTFFDIDQNQYEEYEEKIDLLVEMIDCLYKAEIIAELSIVQGGYGEDQKQMSITCTNAGAKAYSKFVRNTGCKYYSKDVLRCLDNLQENELIKNIAKGLSAKQDLNKGIKGEFKDGKFVVADGGNN